MGDARVIVDNVHVVLGGRPILRGVSFKAVDGVNLVLGPNGSGKTTLLRTIAGVYRPVRGSVVVRGRLGYMPAEFSNVGMRVLDVLLAGGGRNVGEYLKWLEVVGLSGFEERVFSTLSTGQKKLVLLAKALTEGDVVLMDEPTANLDVSRKSLLIDIIRRLRGKKTFVIATHDLDLLTAADEVLLMSDGLTRQVSVDELDGHLLSKVYGTDIARVNVGGRYVYVPVY